jgi:predicted TIM-barrel fold metal-dependent hydrolase
MCWEDKYGTDPSEWLKTLDRHGVDMAALMGHRGLTGPSDIRRSNDIIRETCDRSGERLIPVATVHPDSGDEAVRELERCLKDLNMRGLKLHPWLQGCSLSGPSMDALAELCGKYGVPVIFHDGTPCYSMPEQVGGLALRNPETVFVLGHGGLLELWRSAISFTKHCPNLYITLCGPHLAAIRAIVDSVDPDRILWGTDYGFGWSDPVGYRKGIVDIVSLSRARRAKIMGRNAAKLFGIKEKP